MSTEPEPSQSQAHQPPPPVPPVMAPIPAALPQSLQLRKSPGLAVVLSFFPGLGHLYLGMYQRAIGVLAAFAAAIWFTDHIDAFGVVVAFVWFFGLIDAYRQAQLINAGYTPEPLAGMAVPASVRRRGNLGFGVFLTALGLLLLYDRFYPIDFSFLFDWWPLILVGFGIWMIVSYALEQKRRRDAEAKADAEEWQSRS